MSVLLVAEEDARSLAKQIESSLQKSGTLETRVENLSFTKYLASTINTDINVVVIFLSTKACDRLKFCAKDEIIEKLCQYPKSTVVITSCSDTIKQEILSTYFGSCTEDNIFDVTIKKKLFQADAHIRYLVSELRTFVIKPNQLYTNLAEGLDREDSVVIFIDEESDDQKAFKGVTVKTSIQTMEARKISSNVWSFPMPDFRPGEHQVRVFADGIDQGISTIHVYDCQQVPRKNNTDLQDFLAECLHLDKNQFDKELADVFGSSSFNVIEKFLQYFEGDAYPTLLHFLAKHGLDTCIDWYKQKDPDGFRMSCTVYDKRGKTPHILAREANQNELLIRKLGGDDEDLEYLPSPFDQQRRDSGTESMGSAGSVDPPTLGHVGRNKFKKQRSHDYEEIEEQLDTMRFVEQAVTPEAEVPYSRPWDIKNVQEPHKPALPLHRPSEGNIHSPNSRPLLNLSSSTRM